ncbi:MAG TPA: tetratricopeptide repeat protein, partial [Terracidiphilus sp.]|nr:tetratricopeptide repeat protein [Terracidiphilus sp.]
MNLTRTLLIFARAALLLAALPLAAQTTPRASATEQTVEQLLAAQQWQQVADRLAPVQPRSAQQSYDYGAALAHLGRWQQARAALEAGERMAPGDAHFPIELAGIAFKQKQYPRAAACLRRALKLSPGNDYANNFLATVYYLEDNLPAALKYWNRAGKPRLAEVRVEPALRVSPALLDHAFAFAPDSLLTPRQLADSETRVGGLGIFPQAHFSLRARSDGNFDMVFRAQESNGFGDGKLETLFLLLRGLPFQSIEPEYDNAGGRAVNVQALLRWDAQKRRAYARFSGPLEGSTVHRFAFTLDLRNENWEIRRSFAGPAPVLASLNLRREVGAFQLLSSASDRLQWSAEGELSHRDYRSVVPGTVLTPGLLAAGFELKQTAELRSTLLRVPERRFTLAAEGSSQAARLWSPHPQAFEKLQASLDGHWFPCPTGRDYETTAWIRAGRTFGQPP